MRRLFAASVLFLCAVSADASEFPVRQTGRCLKDRGSSRVTIQVQSDRTGLFAWATMDPPPPPAVASCIERSLRAHRWDPWATVRHTLVVIDFPERPRLK